MTEDKKAQKSLKIRWLKTNKSQNPENLSLCANRLRVLENDNFRSKQNLTLALGTIV